MTVEYYDQHNGALLFHTSDGFVPSRGADVHVGLVHYLVHSTDLRLPDTTSGRACVRVYLSEVK